MNKPGHEEKQLYFILKPGSIWKANNKRNVKLVAEAEQRENDELKVLPLQASVKMFKVREQFAKNKIGNQIRVTFG